MRGAKSLFNKKMPLRLFCPIFVSFFIFENAYLYDKFFLFIKKLK